MLLAAIPLLAVLAGSIIGLLYALAKTPLVDQVPAAQTIVFTDRAGHEIGTLSTATQNRRIVPFSDIPKTMRNAALAAEDRDFYEHGALSYRSMMRASLANIIRRDVAQGGSTISQQYVKNAFPNVGRRRNILRKLKEGVIAVKLEKKYSKDQILGFYLNTVYFGKGAYGVDAAARTFFGHPAKKLTLQESALLAATIRVPEFYSRKQNVRVTKARRDFVLRVMEQKGWITHKQAVAAIAKPVKEKWTVTQPGIANSKAPYFLEKVRQYLLDHYDAARLAQSGFRVTTTIDMSMQHEAAQAVEGVLDRPGDPLASLVAIDPKTGAVRAMYGGNNFAKNQLNLATDSQRQAGSTMKPFVLQQALEDGYSAESRFPGPSEIEIDGVKVHNFGNEQFPDITLLDATKHSVNTVFVQLIQKVGAGRVAELAHRVGLDDVIDVPRAGQPKPAEQKPLLEAKTGLALGIDDVSTLQLASAFGTWADQGVHHKAYLVERITDSAGHLIERHQDNGVQVLGPNGPDIANTVTLALKGVVDGGTATRAQLPNCQVAGKTGTTNNAIDARFVGYTSDLVTSVWMGYENRDPNKPGKPLRNLHGFGEVSGGTLPAIVWRDFMRKATEGLPCQPFPQPQLTGIVLNSTTTTSTTTTTTLPPLTRPRRSFPPRTSQPPATTLFPTQTTQATQTTSPSPTTLSG
ncbi:MAG TPA: transglycosylase domain-containing protein [Actinomycetes bacterium]|jgi:penicillin-binding protein 1A|nr:transglycosylase domain-containing protein [Actinomycetes bacterium]